MKKILFVITLCFSFLGFSQTKYKCMLQMSSYQGEAAYVVVSLVNAEGEYIKTLGVLGDNRKWYRHFKNWFSFYRSNRENIDSITGASITGGDRRTIDIELDKELMDKGYAIRFESAVEGKEYYKKDVEVPFSKKKMFVKNEGSGYVKYVKFKEIK